MRAIAGAAADLDASGPRRGADRSVAHFW